MTVTVERETETMPDVLDGEGGSAYRGMRVP